jgi:chromosome segregation ATPase
LEKKLKENISKLEEDKNKLKNDKEELEKKMNENISKLEEENKKYKNEKEELEKKLKSNSSDSETEINKLKKEKFEMEKKLEEEINKLKSEKNELEKKVNLNASASAESIKDKQHYESLIEEYKKKKDDAIHQMNACLEKCSKLMEDNRNYQDSISIQQTNAAKIAEQLTKYKNMIDKVNLRNQMYHIIKIGVVSNTDIYIYFGKNKDGNYVMRIDDKKNIEYVNIQDVEYVTQIEKEKNKIQISYMYKTKKYIINALVDEFVIKELIEAYKNFYTESMKLQNELRF